MNRILIDTNVYTAFMLGQKNVVTTLSFAQKIFISPTVMGELLAGFKNGSKETQS